MVMAAPGRTLRVAAVQMASCAGAVKINLDRAADFASKAASMGADLILLPELMATGYDISPRIWETAEPIGGRISTWLCETAERLHIHIGTTILEVDNDDFFNTFLLATPTGDIAGTVRKSNPAWIEARYYRGHSGPKVIETVLGRLGVGICYDNYLGANLRAFSRLSIDLLLQPTAAAIPPPYWPIGQRGAQAFNKMLKTLAQRHARALGVPVVMADMCGPLTSPTLGMLGTLNTHFAGLSSIVDGSGEVLASLTSEEDVIVGTIKLGSRNGDDRLLPRGYWSAPMPWYAPAWTVVQHTCAVVYITDRTRKASARGLSRLRADQL